MSSYNKKQPGATSLIVVLIVGMILMVMVGGIAALTLREQRQAINTDQSNRALQTAEAGVKFAVQRIVSDPQFIAENIDVCGEDNIKNSTNAKVKEFSTIFSQQSEQQITCMTIGNQFTSYEGFLEKDKATQVIIETPASELGPYSLQLKWHSDTLDPKLANYSFVANSKDSKNNGFYPGVNGYNAAAAPEISFIRWPKTSFTASPEGLPIETVFFMPGQPDQSEPDNKVTSGCSKDTASEAEKVAYGAYRCVTNPQIKEGFNINQATRLPSGANSSNFNYAIRIKPRYADTHFQLNVFDSSGKQLLLQSSKAVIDITARSGNLYRRIKAEKPINPTALENTFDSVLFSNGESTDPISRNICKGLVVKDNFTLAPAQNPSCKQY